MRDLREVFVVFFSKLKSRKNKMLLPEFMDSIDPSIRSLVNYCDDIGLMPLASCSGVSAEHDENNPFGQLLMFDSKYARKIAAYFIDKPEFNVTLSSKPIYQYELYGNKINDATINLSFINPNNEVLPYIEEAIRGITQGKINVDQEKIQKVNEIMDFFKNNKARTNIMYKFNNINFNYNCDTLEFDTYDVDKEHADVNTLVKEVAQDCDLDYINTDKDKFLNLYQVIIPCDKRNEKLKDVIKSSLKRGKKIKNMPVEKFLEEYDYDYDYSDEDGYDYIDEYEDVNNSFYDDLKSQINDDDDEICAKKDSENEKENKQDVKKLDDDAIDI